MIKATKDTKAGAMSTSTIIIIMGDMQVEVKSSEVGTTYHNDQSGASGVATKVTSMQNIHTNTETILNFVPVVVLVITL